MAVSFPARRLPLFRRTTADLVRRRAAGLAGLAAAGLFAAALALSAALPAAAQGVVKSVHGEWQIRCDTPPGAQAEQCVLLQSVRAEDRPNVGLTVIVLKTADNKSRLLRVLAPLGVILPKGLRLVIDEQDVIGPAPFVRCLPNGCIAEGELTEQMISKLKNGKSALFIFFETEEEGIGVPLSLNGFGPGFDSLR
ncbi:invasion associated locus B family protein [Xanthobacter sp. AM11]|uniref:invasion associated locus B family protein n=1 Tax=Xanthobacter sp. AM11 TaxID=3380643 RepID=UPI0039BEE13F